MNAVRPSTSGVGVGALAVALMALPAACYPNPDDLRVSRGGGGSGGASGGSSGAAGGANGSAGMSGGLGGSGPPGAGGRVGAGGSIGAGGSVSTGGSGGAGTTQCGGPACGGNLLGTWTYFNTCSSLAYGDCAGEVLDASGVHRAGTLTFNNGGTYSTTVTDTGTFIFDWPTACLNGTTCAQLQVVYQGAGYVGQPNPTFSSATCSTTTTGCRCFLGALGTPQIETGTYVASGTSVTTTSSTGAVNADTYCVSGSILHLIYADSTPAMPDESVFTKP